VSGVQTEIVRSAGRLVLLAAAIIAATLSGCTPSGSTAEPTSTVTGSKLSQQPSGQPTRPPSNAAARCTVVTGALPVWARAGFTPPTAPQPHVVGVNGTIVGVLFGYPLRSPARPDRSNKILWVSRVAAQGPLTIEARLSGSTRVESRTVENGPGPSIIDMPAAGCWIFTLSWSGQEDQVAVPYRGS
jgi:hypothetical protein